MFDRDDLSLTSLLSAIDQRDDRVIFRSTTGIDALAGPLVWIGPILALGALPCIVRAQGTEQTMFIVCAVGAVGLALLGLLMRLAARKKTVDFDARRIVDGGDIYEFDDLSCVAITEGLQVIRPNRRRRELPTYRVLLGFGRADVETLRRKLTEIRSADRSDDFVAAHSRIDEEWVDELMRDDDLHTVDLFEHSNNCLAALWRTSHRLAGESGAAFVDLTGGDFSAAPGDIAGGSLADRLARREHPPGPPDLRGADIEVSIPEQDDLSVTWQYSLWDLIVGTLLASGVITLVFVSLEWPLVIELAFGAVSAGVTLAVLRWLTNRHGEHRLTITDDIVTYRPPSGGEDHRLALDDLYEVYLRQNLSGGMSTLLLLTDGDPVVVRGELTSLEALRDAIYHHLAAREPGDTVVAPAD